MRATVLANTKHVIRKTFCNDDDYNLFFILLFTFFFFAFVIEIVFVFVFSFGVVDKKHCVEHVRRFERRREQARRFVAVSPTGWQSGNKKKKTRHHIVGVEVVAI